MAISAARPTATTTPSLIVKAANGHTGLFQTLMITNTSVTTSLLIGGSDMVGDIAKSFTMTPGTQIGLEVISGEEIYIAVEPGGSPIVYEYLLTGV